MTDARFPERWLHDRRVLRLSDHAFRSFVISLTWSVSNRTEGVIDTDDLKLIPAGFDPNDVGELVTARLWVILDTGWLIDEFAITQTTKGQLVSNDRQRADAAERKRRQREKQREERAGKETAGQPTVTRDVTEDMSQGTYPVTSQARTGQANASPVLATLSNSSLEQPADVTPLFKSNLVVTNWGTSLGPDIDQIKVTDEARKLVHAAVPNQQLRSRRTRDGLYGYTQTLLNDEAEPEVLAAVLAEWAATTDVYPGHLPHMFTEAIKRRTATRSGNSPTPIPTSELRFRQAQALKRNDSQNNNGLELE